MHLARRFRVGRWLIMGLFGGWLAAGACAETTLPPTYPPNQISIVAQTPTAYAAAGIPAKFLLTRVGGNPLEGVTVSYQVSGRAAGGQDYQALKGTRTFQAGQTRVHITIHPLVVAGSAGTTKGVRVTLLTGDGYAVTAESSAKVKIVQ